MKDRKAQAHSRAISPTPPMGRIELNKTKSINAHSGQISGFGSATLQVSNQKQIQQFLSVFI